MLLTYFLNDFEIVPVAPIITGITFVFTFHMCCISIVRYYYYYYYYYYYTKNCLDNDTILLFHLHNCKRRCRILRMHSDTFQC